ncbi:MAG: hypothetical protein LBB75_08185, partial [Oscillospiraceae bacterium]|nr:hypothetical protein [Oscillospiraceae bacterium]
MYSDTILHHLYEKGKRIICSGMATHGIIFNDGYSPLCRATLVFFTPSVALGRCAARHVPLTVRFAHWGRLWQVSESLS